MLDDKNDSPEAKTAEREHFYKTATRHDLLSDLVQKDSEIERLKLKLQKRDADWSNDRKDKRLIVGSLVLQKIVPTLEVMTPQASAIYALTYTDALLDELESDNGQA